jgi:hypothetical protein
MAAHPAAITRKKICANFIFFELLDPGIGTPRSGGCYAVYQPGVSRLELAFYVYEKESIG